ncbi:YggT family protein [Calderihabitans maritimus]|uniref:YggT family protein n=1 Tax=Calderihabitans maritimus TaxID=1246530 RepID=UPI000B508BEC|nr:YggT family protein [Calderihabitans maritimus]
MRSLIPVIDIAFNILDLLIIARVLLSWVRPDPYNPIVRFIYETTEPILAPFRRIMPRGTIPIDFSPLLALLVLDLARRLLIQILLGF